MKSKQNILTNNLRITHYYKNHHNLIDYIEMKKKNRQKIVDNRSSY